MLLSRTLSATLIGSISLGCLTVVRNTCELQVKVITAGHKANLEQTDLKSLKGLFTQIIHPHVVPDLFFSSSGEHKRDFEDCFNCFCTYNKSIGSQNNIGSLQL